MTPGIMTDLRAIQELCRLMEWNIFTKKGLKPRRRNDQVDAQSNLTQ